MARFASVRWPVLIGAAVGSSGGNLATCRGLNQLERVMFCPFLVEEPMQSENQGIFRSEAMTPSVNASSRPFPDHQVGKSLNERRRPRPAFPAPSIALRAPDRFVTSDKKMRRCRRLANLAEDGVQVSTLLAHVRFQGQSGLTALCWK